MTTEEMLKQAAKEYAVAIDREYWDPAAYEHDFSPKFQRKMKRLARKAEHPGLYRVGRIAAIAALAVFLGFGSVLTFSAKARSAVCDWIKKQDDQTYDYHFTQDPQAEGTIYYEFRSVGAESADYVPNWMPKGYELVTVIGNGVGMDLLFTNVAGNAIQFSYCADGVADDFQAEGTCYAEYPVTVQGLPGMLYEAEVETECSIIIWMNEADDMCFAVTGKLSQEELLQIAENIVKR